MQQGAAEQFCCEGCRGAYEILHACNLQSYYDQARDDRSRPARASGRGYDEFDDAAFVSHYVAARSDGLAQIELLIEGVHCAACVWLLERLPRTVPGVIESELNFRQQTLRVVFDPARVRVSAIARGIDRFGYRPHPAKDRGMERLRRSQDHRWLVQIGIAGACAGNVMILAFALYGGVFGGIQAQYEQLFRWLSMVIGVVCLAWPGRVFFKGAWSAIRTRSANLDLPICFALGTGGVMGVINTVLGRGEIYFDSVTAIVFLLLIGRFIQHRQQRWASDAVELLLSIIPARATRLTAEAADDDAGQRQSVPIEAITPGDLIEVSPDETIPVDGRVESGTSAIDESLLTGESRPVEVVAGSAVAAGTTNLSGVLRVRVLATGRHTRAGRIMAMVDEASRRRPQIAHFTDRVARGFVVGVGALALFTLLLWLFIDPSRAIDHAAAMLIVTCPCMLGLAVPLVMASTIGRGARRGILIKGGDVLEKLSTPGLLMLDKTGTLTESRLHIAEWTGDERARTWASAVEAHSRHPIARAFDGAGRVTMPATQIEQTLGGGIRGRVDGVEVAVGSARYMEKLGAVVPSMFVQSSEAMSAAGRTPVLIAADGLVVAAAGLEDTIRPGTREMLGAFARDGWKMRVISGDHPSAVGETAATLGLLRNACAGGVTPEGKAEMVTQALREGPAGCPVVMVGDGVNDAAAMAAASVGIAVHGGAEASMAAADVYLSRPGLEPIGELLDAARKAMRSIRWALWASLTYNIIAAGLTLAGLITPWLAAILMPLNSLTVTLIAVNTPAFRGRAEAGEGGRSCP